MLKSQEIEWKIASIAPIVIARLSLDTTRLSYTEEPKVVLAEEMRFEDAHRCAPAPVCLSVCEESCYEN